MDAQRKLLWIVAGGTITMAKHEQHAALVPSIDARITLEDILEVARDPTGYGLVIEEIDYSMLDSTEMDRSQWEDLAALIGERVEQYDGFLVTMGTNTMAYASSALTYALLGMRKPVVLTGAQLPAGEITSDARNNILNALRVLKDCQELHGVYVVFGSKIIRGCRAKKVSESALDAFNTFNNNEVGTIGVKIAIRNPVATGSLHERTPFAMRNRFEDDIVSLTLVPGLKAEFIMGLIEAGAKGLVLRAYGSGDIPECLLPALRMAQTRRIPVVVTTQCPGGATEIGMNDPGRKALELGAIPAHDMSMEAMTTKLMWLLGRQIPYEEIKTEMERNYAGEIDPSR